MKVTSGVVTLTVSQGKQLATFYVQAGHYYGRDAGWVWWVEAEGLPALAEGRAGQSKTWAGAYRAAMRCAERALGAKTKRRK